MSHQPLASEIPVYTLKVYAYDYLISYSAPYLINGREFRVSFREGAEWPIYRPAEFRTTDPLIQQAIEAHPTFGTNVRILQVLTHVPHLINPLPPDFPRTPHPSPPPASPLSPTPMPRRIRRALTRSLTHSPAPPAPRSETPVTGAPPAPRSETAVTAAVTGAARPPPTLPLPP